MEKKFAVHGMTCAACSAHVTKAVSKLDGVESVNVNLMANDMLVNFNEAVVTPEDICAAVKNAGYSADFGKTAKEKDEAKGLFRRFVASLCLLLPLMYISMGHMLGAPLPQFLHNPEYLALAQAVLTVPILVINFAYFVSGVKSLLHRAPTMDALVAIGSAASFIYGVYATVAIFGGNPDFAHKLYFESAAMIPTLITLGRFLEARSKKKTAGALAGLVSLTPKTATLFENGKERVVPIDEVKPGDILAVKNGASLPVDGIVVSGECTVNEANITGESMPVLKKEGDRVTCATVCTSGYVLVRAEKVGKDTLMSQIVRLVEAASASKAPVGRLADKVSGIFVPCVMGIAVLTAALWLVFGGTAEQAFTAGVSVLVISCPCALGLATPVAIMAGTGKGAELGVLFKDAAALEALGKIDSVVFDKTGTLTFGTLSVYETESDRKDFAKIAASVEAKSEHPIARAIAANADGVFETQNFKTFSGNGVSAEISGKVYVAGNLEFLEKNGVDTSKASLAFEKYSHVGTTPIFFAEDGEYIGCIAVSDVLRDGAKECVQSLKASGKSVYMLTGDNAVTAAAVAKTLEIENVFAGVLPQEKQQKVAELMGSAKTAFVGDGVNDAPALAAATVGIAMRSGTEIAAESADAVLVHKNLKTLDAGVKIAEKTMRIIKQNLFWAFFYNTVGIPIAAFGLLNPMICAAAMSLSSVTVVTNALRIFGKLEKEKKGMKKTVFIEGMMCMHCVAHVKQALEGLGLKAEVDLKKGTAAVEGDASNDAIIAAVTAAGYKVTDIK